MLMVGGVVLPGILFGMGKTMCLIRQHNVLCNADGARTMRNRDHDRSQQKRKHQRNGDDKFRRARLGCEDT